jgi:CRP/FNR family transcriptional regulator
MVAEVTSATDMNTQFFKEDFSAIFPFWKELSSEQQDDLCRTSYAITFLKGATIHSGDECTGVILIKSGCLRVYMMSEDGKDITLYRLYKGDVCVLSASCALNTITFDVHVDAEEPSNCVIISGCAFSELCERVPAAKIYALEATVSRFSEVMWAMEQILFMSFDRRLAIFLMDESAKTGSDSIRLTHEQIARYMGSAREVVSRMLKYFSAEGIVENTRGGIKILDKRRLRELTL